MTHLLQLVDVEAKYFTVKQRVEKASAYIVELLRAQLIQSLHEQRWDPFDGGEAPDVAQTLLMIGKSAIPALQEFLESCRLTENQGQDKVLYVLERMGPKANDLPSRLSFTGVGGTLRLLDLPLSSLRQSLSHGPGGSSS